MKILIRNSDNVVIYAQDDLILTATMTMGKGWRDQNFNSSNATLTEATLPSLWIGGAWTYSNNTWAVHDTTINTKVVGIAQESKWESIKAFRDAKKFDGVLVSGKWIHTDTYSRTQWLAMVMMGSSLPSIAWTTLDKTTINTTPALATAVFGAVATQDATIFATAVWHQTQMMALADPTQYDFSANWPATYTL